METKPCEQCGALLTKRYKNSATEWAARKFCSRRCAALSSPNEKRPAVERLADMTDKSTGLGPQGNCWEWKGFRTPFGHGRMKDDRGKHTGAHRVAYEAAYGVDPADRFVCHRCDNPACVRPDHLFLGDSAANMSDMSIKGRAARGERNFNAKLSASKVRNIRSDSRSNVALGAEYGVSPHTISRIKHGHRWAHI